MFYNQPIPSTSNMHLFNDSFIDYSNQSNSNNYDQSIYLFLIITIWIVLLVTILFGATGNMLVLYVYLNRKDNKTCTFFIQVLAIVDLSICLILAPLELYQITIGIRNEMLCKFYGFFTTHVLYSTLLITVIAFDRYFCICWPLYKIITIRRARLIVVICGLLSSLLAIIPMSEYSTVEHFYQIHDNHSEHFSLKSNDDYGGPIYKHVEYLKTSSAMVSFVVGNTTDVNCSPKFSLQLRLPQFITAYRMFHGTLFATCICLVLILYAFIYNAVYQRRVTRTRKFSAYRRIIRSYLMNNETETTETDSSKTSHHRHHHRRRRRRRRHNNRRHHRDHSPSTLTLICCYCCQDHDDYRHDLQRPSESAFHEPLTDSQRQNYRRHIHDEPSSIVVHSHRPRPQVVLEVNGGRGKRYSAISMTSMTYLTSGVWDEASPTHLIRSRINSIAANTYCGTEHSSNSRPSTSTEDSFEQGSKLLSISNTLTPQRPLTPPCSSHLTVPGHQQTTGSSTEVTIKEMTHIPEGELPRSVSQCHNLLHPSIVRKTSNTLSIRQMQRLSDVSVHQRKVSFLTSTGIVDQCISEDPPSTDQPSNLHPSNSPSPPSPPPTTTMTTTTTTIMQSTSSPISSHQLSVHTPNQRSLSTVSSIDPRNSTVRTYSISSARRPSAFDGETQRILERQQTQERLANIRTTFTLFIVTATFLMMYLPSIIHTLFSIKPHPFREILFLLCYINSACNPLIYSFFNVNFRNDIRRIYECQKREYLARQH